MNKKRRVHILAVILASAVAFAHIQTVDASTINKAKNAKKKAEEENRRAVCWGAPLLPEYFD